MKASAIALLFAYRHLPQMSAAVLCSPSIGMAPDRKQYFQERAALAARDGMRAIIDATFAKAFPDQVVRDREATRLPGAIREQRSGGAAWQYRARGIGSRAVGPFRHADAWFLLARTSLRPPARAREFASRLPHAEFDVIDSGHFMHVQSPREVTARMLTFLRTADD
jgi:3-oxoadipate enol-lactonase